MSFTETLLAGLLLAAISALTVAAYRHPRGYRRIAGVLLLLGLFYGWGRTAGDLGGMNANIRSLSERVQDPNPSTEMVRFTVEMLASNYKDLKWTLVITALTTAYLVFLMFLPNVLGILPTTKARNHTPEKVQL
jgi:hypothetical protein